MVTYFKKEIFKHFPSLKNRYTYLFMSHPKCGRTWMQVMLGKLFSLEYNLHEKCFFLDSPPRLPNKKRIIFSHGGSPNLAYQFNKDYYKKTNVILLVRDPRDVIVSYYHEMSKRRTSFNGSIGQFIKTKKFGIEKIVKYYNQWILNRNILNRFMVIKYEDIHANSIPEVLKICEFLKIRPSIKNIEDAVHYSSFDNMRKIEKENLYQHESLSTKNTEDVNFFKVRSGKVGNYYDELDMDEIDYINNIINSQLNDFYSFYKSN